MGARARNRRKSAKRVRSRRPRLIGYARVSSDEQARNGISLRSQRERIRAYAEANDVELIRIETDDGVSGFKAPDKRPAMNRALTSVRAGDSDGIVAVEGILQLNELPVGGAGIGGADDEPCPARGIRLQTIAEHAGRLGHGQQRIGPGGADGLAPASEGIQKTH